MCSMFLNGERNFNLIEMFVQVLNNPLIFCILLKLFLGIGFISFNQWWLAFENQYVQIIGEFFLMGIFFGGALLGTLVWSWINLIPVTKKDSISKSEKIKTVGGFSVLIILQLIFSVMDICSFVDRYGPKPILVSSFINARDPAIDSLCMIYFLSYNMFTGNLMDFTVFWLVWKGRSWRSLFLFMWSWIAPAMLVTAVVTFKMWIEGTIHPISNWLLWFYPIWLIAATASILAIPRDFTLRTTDPNICFKIGTFVNWLISLAQIGSIFILVGKTYTLTFPDRECFMTNWIRTNDPGLLLNDKDLPWSYHMVQSWMILGMLGPIFAVCILYNLCYKWNKPNWLWDLSLLGFGVILADLVIRLIQEVHYDTPEEYKGQILNFNYWIINGFSVIVALVQVILLYKIKTIYSGLNQHDSKSSSSSQI